MSLSHERTGADGTIVYCCAHCFRIELSSYDGWLWHLGSREHQDANRRSANPFFDPRGPRRPEMLRRCVDVHEIYGLKARQLLDYFKTWGEIEDFSYWYKQDGDDGQAVRCVVFYKELDAADACIREQSHDLEGKKLRVTPFKSGSYGVGRGSESRGRRGRNQGGYGGYREDSGSSSYGRRSGSYGNGSNDSGFEEASRKRKSTDGYEDGRHSKGRRFN